MIIDMSLNQMVRLKKLTDPVFVFLFFFFFFETSTCMYRNTRRGRSPQWIWYTSQNARTMLQYLTRKFTCKTVKAQTEAKMSKSQVSLVGHVDVLIALVSKICLHFTRV